MITVLSLLPGKTLSRVHWMDAPYTDKLAHYAVYAIWASLWVLSLRNEPSLPYRKVVSVFLLITLYGVLMEALQGFVFTGRYFEWLDAAANAMGALSGCLITIVFLKRLGSWN